MVYKICSKYGLFGMSFVRQSALTWIGHDLVALSGKAKKMGLDDYLVVNREWEINLSNANDYYYKKDFEYFNVAFQYYGLPSLDELNEYSKGLLKSIRQVCIDAASLQSGS